MNEKDFAALLRKIGACSDAVTSAYAADAADAAYAADAADAAARKKARKENQKLTADICRKYLPLNVWKLC